MNKNEHRLVDSDLLHTFVKIAECGNLTIAAGQLGRTQSAISVQLRKLEAGLGTTVFTRTARGMKLTGSGEVLLSRAYAILSNLREATDLFREPLTGVIRVGFPDDFDEAVLERILVQFSRAHQEVQVQAKSGCTAGYAAAIRDGMLDIAVCSGLEAPDGEPLDREEIVWATRKGKTWNKSEPVPLAVLDRQCFWRDLPIKTLDAAGIRHSVSFQSGSFTSLQAALRAGIAVGLLPKSSVGEGLKILTEVEGFPKLPASHRSILTSPQASQPICEAMVEAIRDARLSKPL